MYKNQKRLHKIWIMHNKILGAWTTNNLHSNKGSSNNSADPPPFCLKLAGPLSPAIPAGDIWCVFVSVGSHFFCKWGNTNSMKNKHKHQQNNKAAKLAVKQSLLGKRWKKCFWCNNLGDTRRGSRIFVRVAQRSFDPGGGLSTKFAQNRGFSIKISWKLHDFEKKKCWGYGGGLGPFLDLPVATWKARACVLMAEALVGRGRRQRSHSVIFQISTYYRSVPVNPIMDNPNSWKTRIPVEMALLQISCVLICLHNSKFGQFERICLGISFFGINQDPTVSQPQKFSTQVLWRKLDSMFKTHQAVFQVAVWVSYLQAQETRRGSPKNRLESDGNHKNGLDVFYCSSVPANATQKNIPLKSDFCDWLKWFTFRQRSCVGR